MADVTSILPDFAKDTPIWLGLVATAVGALEGALLARQHKKKLDIAGVLVLAIALGFGGGLIRDVLIGNTPPEVLRHWEYSAAVGLAVVVILTLGRQIARFAYTLFLLDVLPPRLHRQHRRLDVRLRRQCSGGSAGPIRCEIAGWLEKRFQ